MKIHFIAIGGSAMHNLAIALKINGHEVTGSDDEIFEPSRGRLKKYGLLPKTDGWHPEMISNDLDAIILGMHARPDNPELLRAQETGAKIYSYPEFLFEHAKNKRRVVVGGSHGKTTITAMIIHVLKYWNKDFDYLVGSKLKDFEVMVRLSKEAPVMIFEGDEYLSSSIDRRPKFHWYHPHLTLLSGIAWDHINVFPTCENYLEQFSVFIDLVEKKGTLIYNAEDDMLHNLITKSTNDIQKIPYQTPDFEIIGGTSYVFDGKSKIPLKIFGRHNLLNLNGARLVCNELGINEQQFYAAVSGFKGAAKRLELILQKGRGRFYSDFAHAPSKLNATLSAVKGQFPDQQVLACFELHTFSSLNEEFLLGYLGTMKKADIAIVYFNPETISHKKLKPISNKQVMDAFGNGNLVIYTDSDLLIKDLKSKSWKNANLLMMSSGNFDGMDIADLTNSLL